MKFIVLKLSVVVLVLLSAAGCSINTNLMLKTDKEYQYDELTDSVLTTATEYVIAPGDIVNFRLYDNGAWIILNIGIDADNTTKIDPQSFNQRNIINYLVENDSTVKLPILKEVKLAGLSVRDAEKFLENQYRVYYEEPFIQLTVTNKRVIVFPGNGGAAQVITLRSNRTTLMEVLAYAEGIAERGKASHIKVMRNIGGVRHVYLIDLSTIEGLKYTDMLVQANDYIYVEPVPEIGREILKDIAPVISILSSGLIVYTFFRTLNN